MKRPAVRDEWEAFLIRLRDATDAMVADPNTSRRDRNVAIANGAKLLTIKHKINPGEEGSFFD